MSPTSSADGVWRNLRLVPELTAPDIALPTGALAAVVVEGGMLRWIGPAGAVPALKVLPTPVIAGGTPAAVTPAATPAAVSPTTTTATDPAAPALGSAAP